MAFAGFIIPSSLPDLRRYIKISTMRETNRRNRDSPRPIHQNQTAVHVSMNGILCRQRPEVDLKLKLGSESWDTALITFCQAISLAGATGNAQVVIHRANRH